MKKKIEDGHDKAKRFLTDNNIIPAPVIQRKLYRIDVCPKRKLFSVTLVIYKIEPRTIVFTATGATMMNGRVKKTRRCYKSV